MKKIISISIVCLTLLGAGCKKKGPQKDAVADKSSAVCIWDKSSLQETPEKKGKWLSSIALGEKLTFLEETKEVQEGGKKVSYHKVRLLDGKEGWVRTDFVAVGANVAVVFDKTDIYSRPDLATITKNFYEATDIVAVKSTQDGWTEVVGKRKTGKWIETAWVKNKNLSFDATNIAVALYVRRALAKTKKEEQIAELRKITENSDLGGSIFEDMINEILVAYDEANTEPQVPELEAETK